MSAVTGDRHPRPSRRGADNLGGGDSELSERTRAGRLDDDIGALDQVSQCFAPGRGVEVEHHTLVTVVQPVEEPRIARPGAIGPVHALDLDNSQIRASEQMRESGPAHIDERSTTTG